MLDKKKESLSLHSMLSDVTPGFTIDICQMSISSLTGEWKYSLPNQKCSLVYPQ